MKRSPYALDLFSGSGSFTRQALAAGYTVSTYDNAPDAAIVGGAIHCALNIFDIGDSEWHSAREWGCDFLWASPPCQGFSVAAIGKAWDKETGEPKSQAAKDGLALLDETVRIISIVKPTNWAFENPRGMMRKKIDAIFAKYGVEAERHTVSYCQYGDTRQKPTDIWVAKGQGWEPRPICKPGADCHVAAPRGSRTGTQGLESARARGVVPAELIREILG